MWPLVVVKANPVTNDPTGALQTLEAVAVIDLAEAVAREMQNSR